MNETHLVSLKASFFAMLFFLHACPSFDMKTKPLHFQDKCENTSLRDVPIIEPVLRWKVIMATQESSGQWVKRTTLKSVVTRGKGESQAVDACLRALANAQYGSCSIYRYTTKHVFTCKRESHVVEINNQ
jgi:hypothetical protein